MTVVPGSIPRIILSSTIKIDSLLKTKQNKRKIFNFIKLFLFLLVSFVVYEQISAFDRNAWSEVEFTSPISFAGAVVLVYFNIWIVYYQWSITLNVLVPETSKQVKHHSFFAGLVTGMLTPNMIGNFIGRFYYFERIHRVPVILFTLLCNYAQFLASIVFGWLAIVLAGELYVIPDSNLLIPVLGVLAILAIALYFFIDSLLPKFRKKSYFYSFKEVLAKNPSYRWKIVGLSLLRFMVFTSQFSLVLHAFGVEITGEIILGIWQVYLITMFAPSLILGKIGVKESIALLVLVGLGVNEYAVLFTSLIIWFINSLSPALVGLAICKNEVRND